MRILVVGMTDKVGGLETFIMLYCEALHALGAKVDFFCRFPTCAFAERIDAIGGRVYHVTRRSRNPAAFYREIHAFFRAHGGEYDVLWENECMANDVTPLRLAKRSGIPLRIYHSHNSSNMDRSVKGRLQGLLHRLHRLSLPGVANGFYACSEPAARWAFPKRILQEKQYVLVRNAIDTAAFAFDGAARERIRREFRLEGRFVVGHVGRFQYQKNHSFLLEAFRRAYEARGDARLLLIGTGEDEARMRETARALGIQDAVVFAGYRTGVPALMQAMDVFALPSLFEGMPVVAVEAQAAGLPCLLADTITKEAGVTDLARFLPIEDPSVWAAAIAGHGDGALDRGAYKERVAAAGYDIHREAERLYARLARGIEEARP